MNWRLVIIEADGREVVSSATLERDEALEWACDLIYREKLKVDRLESTEGEKITSKQILKWSEANIGRRAR